MGHALNDQKAVAISSSHAMYNMMTMTENQNKKDGTTMQKNFNSAGSSSSGSNKTEKKKKKKKPTGSMPPGQGIHATQYDGLNEFDTQQR